MWGEQGTAQTPFGFTGEPTDQNGLVHLRARYYNPALGVFPSLDPLEGSPMQPLGINRYAYVNGDPVNNIDPSGKAAIMIWAAAFIAPPGVVFPYINLNHTPHPFAVWHGDNRSWYDGESPLPVSSRVYWKVEFDTCDVAGTFRSAQDTGITEVIYTTSMDLAGNVGVSSDQAKAPTPNPATFQYKADPRGDKNWDYIEVSIVGTEPFTSNPLSDGAPPIEITYKINVYLNIGTVTYEARVDPFPWHELWFENKTQGLGFFLFRQAPSVDCDHCVNGIIDASVIYEPTSKTPVDLFYTPVTIQGSDEIKGGLDFSCVPSQTSSKFTNRC